MERLKFHLEFVAAALGSAIPLCLITYIFWPGKMFLDTVEQFSQSAQLPLVSDYHPLTMSLLMRLTSNYQSGKTYYFAFQTALVWFCIVVATCLLTKTFLSRQSLAIRCWVALLTAFFLSCCPPSGIFNAMVAKDTPFTALLFLQVSALSTAAYHCVQKSKSTTGIFLLSTLSIVSGIFALQFRHNAFTVVLPLAFVAIMIGWSCSSVREVRVAASSALLLLLIGGLQIRPILKATYLSPTENLTVVPNWLHDHIIIADFKQALDIGMPLTEAGKASLDNIVDWQETWKVFSKSNSDRNLVTYSKTKEDHDLAISVAKRELMKDWGYWWVRAKIRLAIAFLVSRGGFQAPLGYYDDFSNMNLPLNLNMDISKQPLREKFFRFNSRTVTGVDGGGTLVEKILFWTFLPEFICHALIFAFALNRWCRRSFFAEPGLAALGVVLIGSATLVLPLGITSQANDFRYYWPTLHFSIIMLFVVAAMRSSTLGQHKQT